MTPHETPSLVLSALAVLAGGWLLVQAARRIGWWHVGEMLLLGLGTLVLTLGVVGLVWSVVR